jgi:hypothetical protein
MALAELHFFGRPYAGDPIIKCHDPGAINVIVITE